MANSSRDPYWQAAVRREAIDHPSAAAEIEDECCDLPHADGADAGEGGRPAGRDLRAPADRRRDARRTTASPPTACPARCATRLDRAPRDAARASPAASSSSRADRCRRAPDVRPVRDRCGPDGAHALGDRHDADRGARTSAQSELCATCHTLYTQALGPQGEVDRRAARAGAVPRMAAQRVSRGAELPVVPHAGGDRADADRVGAGRARARRLAATRSSAAISSCCAC